MNFIFGGDQNNSDVSTAHGRDNRSLTLLFDRLRNALTDEEVKDALIEVEAVLQSSSVNAENSAADAASTSSLRSFTVEEDDDVVLLFNILRGDSLESTIVETLFRVLCMLPSDVTSRVVFKLGTTDGEGSLYSLILRWLSYPGSSTLLQIQILEFLSKLLELDAESVERGILSCDLGLQCLMDILATEAIHERVRNDMLLLLKTLTRKNSRIKEFIAFSQGFDLLFEVIEQITVSTSELALDCLSIMRNVLTGSVVTQKMFFQGDSLPRILSILEQGAEIIHEESINKTSNGSAPIGGNDFAQLQLTLQIILLLIHRGTSQSPMDASAFSEKTNCREAQIAVMNVGNDDQRSYPLLSALASVADTHPRASTNQPRGQAAFAQSCSAAPCPVRC